MQVLNQMSLALKLCLLLVAPVVLMLYFVTQVALTNYNAAKEAAATDTLPTYFEAMSNVVHEMQLERGISVGFVVSKGTKFISELRSQRSKVDEAISALLATNETYKATNKPDFTAGVEALLGKMEAIGDARRRVSSLSMSTGELLPFYTSLIMGNINLV
ncbi:MAG: nitrate- and nitrite sensing domain-containing protein, partial [Pseudomonadota bacterium]